MMSCQTIAVLSDIHSNYHAFKACYDDAATKGVDSFIFLGDYISDLAEPERTMDLVYEIRSHYPTVCLRGNRERYMLEHEQGMMSFVPGSKSGSLLFTYEHLRQQDLDFFRSLPISDSITLGGVAFELAHASTDDDRYYFDDSDIHCKQVFRKIRSDYLLTGHSHKQYMQRFDGKTVINPGSVGIPQGGTVWPKYAILRIADGAVSCSLQEVRYDICAAIHSQFRRGLVDRAKYWAIGVLYDIITGKEWALKLLDLAASSGDVHDEAAWHNAAVQLGMHMTVEDIIRFCKEHTAATVE